MDPKFLAFCTLYDIDPETLDEAAVAGIEKALEDMHVDNGEAAIHDAIEAVEGDAPDADENGLEQEPAPIHKGLFDKALGTFRKTLQQGLFGEDNEGNEEDEEGEGGEGEAADEDTSDIDLDLDLPDDEDEGAEPADVDETDETDETDEDDEPGARKPKLHKSVAAGGLQVVDGEQLMTAMATELVSVLEPLYKAVEAMADTQESIRKGLHMTPRSNPPHLRLLDKRFTGEDDADGTTRDRSEVIDVTQAALEKGLGGLEQMEALAMQNAAGDPAAWPNHEPRFQELKKAIGE
jgi:hypothetical protein